MIRHSRLTVFGVVLCLLAALFAVEAKMAWYSPAGSARAEISAAKLQPADVTKLISHLSNSAPFQIPQAPDFYENAAVMALALLCMAAMSLVARLAPRHQQVCAAPSFSAPLFFRPPPIL